MLRYKDNFGVERGIEISQSMDGKWINWALYTPKKNTSGSTQQIPVEHKDELLKMINNIKESTNV